MIRHDADKQAYPSLGMGVYHLAEVARYTQVHASSVRAWFKGRPDRQGRGPVLEGDYRPVGGDFAVSFHDLIDTLVAGQFRTAGVSMAVVRAAYRHLAERLHTRHPFCHHDLYTDGRKVFIHAADNLGDDVLSEVVSRQQFFAHVRETLTRIDYHESSLLARRWRLYEGVVIDPAISMGKPVVGSTGITTYVLANCYHANKRNIALVADLFNVSERDIDNAVAFEASFGARCAA